ncbi:YobI family P-loop NTPase [Parvimonas micra]
MEKDNPKFNALTPEVLEENNEIYTKALDFAFDNKDIKNIAITGIYGAGKSTVWNTYVKETKKENIITVSLGKYEDTVEEINTKSEESETKDKDTEYNKIGEHILDNENRVERQIINQILSQIKSKDIPLSKYGFKSNKSCCTILFETLAMLGIVSSVLLWINRGSIVDNTGFSYICVLISCIIMLFLSLLYIFYRYFRENILRISKVKFRGAEADLGYNDKNDETVLDRDIKELVYLIKSSKSKIIVFEDLDRYDNIAIYTKLRELNFLLNKYSKTNDNGEVIRFIYMIKDGIFKSKNRTKFFDYIIPIVPVVDSKNSESMILNLLGDFKSLIDKRLIFNISLYIDDMRLIKNIINEFIIYKDIINMKDLELSYDKLFSLIVLKNIFPYEFDMLQEDKGCLFDIINEIENLKNIQRKTLKERNEEIQKELDSKIEYDSLEYKTLINNLNDSIRIEIESLKFIRHKIQGFEKEVLIRKTTEYISFKDLEKDEDKFNKICDLLIEININKKFLNLDKELLLIVSSSEKNNVLKDNSKTITNKNYLSLISVLIEQGYLDKNYWHYKGYFYKGSLGVNDIIFIKHINEAKEQDHLLDVETPSEIINRLEKEDFYKFNILNKRILEYCINEDKIEYVVAISTSVFDNKDYKKLAEILESYDYDIIERYIFILLTYNTADIVELLEISKNFYFNAYNNILIAIYTNEHIDTKTIEKFNLYLENNWKVVSLLPENRKDIFYNNISNVGVKFIDLQGDEINTDIIKNIESLNAYKLCVKNIVYITEKILGKSVQYGNLLSEIYNSSLLECKKYIDNNFESFLIEYINGNNNENFTNDEKILIKILNLKISNEYKIKYLRLNNTELTNISDIINDFKNEDLLNCMFDRNIILFNKDNVKFYYNNIKKSSKEFIDYVERNLNESNVDEILKGNPDMCNEFINNPELRDGLFEYIYKYATKPVETIDSNLSKERINLLIKQELIEINYKNINFLLEKNWKEIIIMWVTSTENDIQDEFVDILLDCELEEKEDFIYKLINSKILDENAMKLVDLIESGVLIEKINSDKENLISSIIDIGLSNDNINYICNNFEEFKLKARFIDNLVRTEGLSALSNDNLNDDVMTFILKLKDLDVDIKIDLICKKIDNDIDVSLLKKYIGAVKEISELAEVWENKRPKLETDKKLKVGNKLLEKGIVKRFGNGNPIKIYI